jgi:hypothetical protein
LSVQQRRTLLRIRVKEQDRPRCESFLKEIGEFDKSLQMSKPNQSGYIEMNFYYNRRFDFSEKIGRRFEIRRTGGRVVDFISLYPRKPRINPKTRRILNYSTLIGISTFVSGFLGVKLFSPDILQAFQFSIIPSIVAFLTEFIIEYKRRSK